MPVIVWAASYPRSGNTFLRIALHRLYGVPTYVVYDVDSVVSWARMQSEDHLGADDYDARGSLLRRGR